MSFPTFARYSVSSLELPDGVVPVIEESYSLSLSITRGPQGLRDGVSARKDGSIHHLNSVLEYFCRLIVKIKRLLNGKHLDFKNSECRGGF